MRVQAPLTILTVPCLLEISAQLAPSVNDTTSSSSGRTNTSSSSPTSRALVVPVVLGRSHGCIMERVDFSGEHTRKGRNHITDGERNVLGKNCRRSLPDGSLKPLKGSILCTPASPDTPFRRDELFELVS